MNLRPTKLAAELVNVYGVPSIMAGTVLYPVNKVFVFTHCFKNELENFEIAAHNWLRQDRFLRSSLWSK